MMNFDISIRSKVILSLGVSATCLLLYKLHYKRDRAGRIHARKPIVRSEDRYCFVSGTTVILQSNIEEEIEGVFWKKRKTTEDTFTNIKIDNKKYIGGSVASPSLVIVSVGEEDVGLYICRATNNAGEGESGEIEISVKDASENNAGVIPMQSGFNQVIQLLEMASRTNTHIHLTVANKVKNCIIGENGLVVNQGALDFDPKRLIEKIVESSCAAKDEAEKCVAMYGKIQEFFIQSGTDVRNVTVSFKVDDDKELPPDFKEVLQKQIADAINVSNERIINIELIRHCILVFFDVDGASFPWETSSLILAERFRTGLTDGSIRLTDDKGETLAVCTETTIINMKTTSERTPVVAIGQGGYIMTAGEVTILTCTTLSSSPVTSVKWFRINKEEGIKTAIEIDNKKYYGGSIETPSLVIDNTCPEDVGQYVCHARNKYGSSKSPPTFLLVFSKVAMESSRARIEHLAYKQDITSTNGQTIPINSEIMSINQELVVHHRQDSNLDKPLDRTGATPRNLNGMEDNTSISFDIAGAMFPWEPSALLLAERFQSGLIDGSIRMAHKAGEQMSIRRDSTSIALAAPPDDPDCSGKPIVCLGQGGYMKAVGETSVLACAVVSSSKVTSVKWFRKIDKQKTPSEVQIDNTKYYGGSVDSPSLVINNTDHSDEGFYLCRAENNYGSGESQSALLQTFNSNDSQVTDNEARAVKQETVTTNQTTMEDSPSTAAVKQDALQEREATMKDVKLSKDGQRTVNETRPVRQETINTNQIPMKDSSDTSAAKHSTVPEQYREKEATVIDVDDTKDETNNEVRTIKQETVTTNQILMEDSSDTSAVKQDTVLDTNTEKVTTVKDVDDIKDGQKTYNEARSVRQKTVTTNQTTMEDSPPTSAVKHDTVLERYRDKWTTMKDVDDSKDIKSIVEMVKRGNIDQFEVLTKSLMTEEKESSPVVSILHVVALYGSPEMIECIAKRQDTNWDSGYNVREYLFGIDVPQLQEGTFTALYIAAFLGRTDIVHSLIKYSSEENIDVCFQTFHNNKQLEEIFMSNQAEKLKLAHSDLQPTTVIAGHRLEKDGGHTPVYIVYSVHVNHISTYELKSLGVVIIRNPYVYTKEWKDINDTATTVSPEDRKRAKKILSRHQQSLFMEHSNLRVINVTPVRYKNNGEDIVEKPCIALYCSTKGVIPLGETEFPKRLDTGDGDYMEVDIHEGYFIFSGYQSLPGNCYHKQLKMGCDIGRTTPENDSGENLLSGTLGPFVKFNDKIGFLTCAHVLFDVTSANALDFHYNAINKLQIVQPSADSMAFGGSPCGHVRRAIFNPQLDPSIDVAVVDLTDSCRIPENGQFAIGSHSSYKKAGFQELPEYNSGYILNDVTCLVTSPTVYTFGSASGVTRGLLDVCGISVRPRDTALRLPKSGNDVLMINQYQIIGIPPSPFFVNGDSGAAVFMRSPGTGELVLIGMVVGLAYIGTNPFPVGIVTPIGSILQALGPCYSIASFQ